MEPGSMPFTCLSLWKDHLADFTGCSRLLFEYFSQVLAGHFHLVFISAF